MGVVLLISVPSNSHFAPVTVEPLVVTAGSASVRVLPAQMAPGAVMLPRVAWSCTVTVTALEVTVLPPAGQEEVIW